jgi:toxin ParE1/3/4
MAYEVVWSPTALEDVVAIASYISRDSSSYAGAVVRKIITSTRNLESFPFAGRIVPEFDDKNIREVFAYSYRIVYRVDNEAVTIAAVIHGKRAFVSSPLNERIDQ